jgi:hypothetical protein
MRLLNIHRSRVFAFHLPQWGGGKERISPLSDSFFLCYLYWSDDRHVLRQSVPTPHALTLIYTIIYAVRYNNENRRKKGEPRNVNCFMYFYMLTSSSSSFLSPLLSVFGQRMLALKSSIYRHKRSEKKTLICQQNVFIYSSILIRYACACMDEYEYKTSF